MAGAIKILEERNKNQRKQIRQLKVKLLSKEGLIKHYRRRIKYIAKLLIETADHPYKKK